MATESPNLAFALLSEGQAGAHVNVNEFMILADIFWGGIDGLTTLTTPPGSPSNGDVYLVGTSATGTWTGEDGKLTIYHDGAWRFFVMPSLWSATEQATQLYRDGAQVYTKVISVTPATTGPTTGTYTDTTAHGITGLDMTKPITIEAWFRQVGGTVRYYGSQLIAPYSSGSSLVANLSIDATNITCLSNFSMTGWTIDAKLLYSKT